METVTTHVSNAHHFAPIYFSPPVTITEPVTKKLDRLAFTRDGIGTLQAQRAAIVDAALAEVRTVIDSLDTAIAEMLATADVTVSEIKEAVLAGKASVKGSSLHAVYSCGRVTYDSKGLDALAVVVPEVLKFRKEGDPSVSIREVKH